MGTPEPVTAQVDFGRERMTPAEKTRRVGGVFDAVAERYDLMNDLMSLGCHRLLKRAAVEMARLRPGKRVLDLAGGTGDMARLAARHVATAGDGAAPQVVLADINRSMMAVGRNQLLDRGCAKVAFAQSDAAALPFADGVFDAVLVAFGVRNFTNKEAGLSEMHRVLAKGGVAVVLEFSHVANPLLASGFAAFKHTWPLLGRAVVGDAAPYRYLVESIDRHPDQEALRQMMCAAGFKTVEVHNLVAGAAAIHRGLK